MSPLVSICIPTYNRARYIEATIESCLCQTYENIEVIIYDDGSKDDTGHLLRKYSLMSVMSKITVINSDYHHGTGYARNSALKYARGDLIVNMDSDDYLSFNSIETRVKEFERHPELDVVCGLVKAFRGKKSLYWCLKHSNKLRLYGGDITTVGIMLHRRVIEKYGGYYEHLILRDDTEYWYRIGLMEKDGKKRKTGIKVKKVTDVCAYARIH